MHFIVHSIDDLDGIAEYIFSLLEPGCLIYLSGQLGAGKTTLCKKLFDIMELRGRFCSPTFTYKNEYGLIHNKKCPADISICNVCHFDLYRIENFDQIYSLEIFESLADRNNICLVEWPDILFGHENLLFKTILEVKIEYFEDSIFGHNSRRIIIEKKVDRGANLSDI